MSHLRCVMARVRVGTLSCASQGKHRRKRAEMTTSSCSVLLCSPGNMTPTFTMYVYILIDMYQWCAIGLMASRPGRLCQ